MAVRAQRLNDLIAFGVPLSLIVGMAGANLFIGGNHPGIEPGDEVDRVLGLWTQLRHLAGIVAPIAFAWALICFWITRGDRKAGLGFRMKRGKYWSQAVFWASVSLSSLVFATSRHWISWLESIIR